jgi:hypothetical protein
MRQRWQENFHRAEASGVIGDVPSPSTDYHQTIKV